MSELVETSAAEDETPVAPVELQNGEHRVTSDAALLPEDARFVMSRRGATVVLLLAEVHSGKSTLLAELWTEFLLSGEVGGHAFAGSVTALAFEERAFLARVRSGRTSAETARTAQADDGFLHLRVRRPDGRLVELLLADVTGEHFRNIREGTRLDDELSWTERVDRFLVLVDGQAFAQPESREVTVTRTQRLLHALAESGQIAPSSRVAVVLAKEDLLDEAARQCYATAERDLLEIARTVDASAAAWRTAARPSDLSAPRGLGRMLDWVAGVDRAVAVAAPAVAPRPTRAMSRFQS